MNSSTSPPRSSAGSLNTACAPQSSSGPPSTRCTEEPSSPLRLLLEQHTPGRGLAREFFIDETIYRADLDAIWRTGWLFAGHACEIPHPGDFFTLTIDTDPIVVVRHEDNSIRAFHNVCRHRGSLVCTEPSGHAPRLVCPYHQWTYSTDGRLIACKGMHPDFDRSGSGLKPVHAENLEGLIFISLADDPTPFALAREALAALVRPQGFERARVAKTVDYLVEANWKLVWENNRECYHCNINHPQYIKANFDHFNADDTSQAVQERMATAAARLEERWASLGIPMRSQTGMTTFPDAASDTWFSANRTPLVDGWVSETMDGQQAAPLMGDYRDAHVGTLRVRALPNFWNHSSCDHGVSTRLLPAGPKSTAIRVSWLVHQDAVEGRDYDLGRIMPFWQLTSEQDWTICRRQQAGVASSAYRPGPYSTVKEYNVAAFVAWYLQKLQRHTP